MGVNQNKPVVDRFNEDSKSETNKIRSNIANRSAAKRTKLQHDILNQNHGGLMVRSGSVKDGISQKSKSILGKTDISAFFKNKLALQKSIKAGNRSSTKSALQSLISQNCSNLHM